MAWLRKGRRSSTATASNSSNGRLTMARRYNELPCRQCTVTGNAMPLLIRNGLIVTADSRSHADIYCEDETITRIGKNLEAPPGAEVIDATDHFVFPGFIDPHVHIYLPFMATFA